MCTTKSSCPPPIPICPQTAAMLHFHHRDPLRLATFDEVGNVISILHALHFALRIEANPPRYVSPLRQIVPSWHVLECVETLVMNGANFSRLMMEALYVSCQVSLS